MKSVYVVGGDKLVIKMFESMGWKSLDVNVVYSEADVIVKTPDIVCFTGGEDVSPHLYGEENAASHCNEARDSFEIEVYEEFLGKVPMVGICRGGQLLNVLNGGKMIQDIKGHHMGIHYVWDHDGHARIVHGDHHQGIIRDVEKSLSLLAANHHPDVHQTVMTSPVGLTEACFYPETKCLCFQPHPEWGHEPTKDLFFQLLEEYIG